MAADAMPSAKVYFGLEGWLREHRDSYPGSSHCWAALNDVLDEVRDAGVTGRLPWEPKPE